MSSLRNVTRPVFGATEFRYERGRLLDCLKFASHLKPSATMSDALADACQVLHGSSTNIVQEELRAGEFQIPSLDTLRMARLKLDYLSVMSERLVFLRFRYIRYVYLDAFPQMGFNFLCMREERLRIPRVGDILIFKTGFNLSQVYETRLCFASVVGHRNATLLKSQQTWQVGT